MRVPTNLGFVIASFASGFMPLGVEFAAASPAEEAMKQCVLQQMRALEDKDIDTYMSCIHPDAAGREDMGHRVKVGMRTGPDFIITAIPGPATGNSMDFEMRFEKVLFGGGTTTNRKVIRVEFRDHDGKPLIWSKKTVCPSCVNGRQRVNVSVHAGYDPRNGQPLFDTTQKTIVCQQCRGTCAVEWRDEP